MDLKNFIEVIYFIIKSYKDFIIIIEYGYYFDYNNLSGYWAKIEHSSFIFNIIIICFLKLILRKLY